MEHRHHHQHSHHIVSSSFRCVCVEELNEHFLRWPLKCPAPFDGRINFINKLGKKGKLRPQIQGTGVCFRINELTQNVKVKP